MGRFDPLSDPQTLIRRVYSYVAYRLGDGPDAEDVTSDVFERALRYRGSYDRSKGQPIAWLIGIARYRIVELSGQLPPEPTSHDVDIPEPSDLDEEIVTRLTVQQAIETLGERDRELVALRYGADMTARQIAQLQGSTTNTVEVALHRVRERLRASLGGDYRPAVHPPARQPATPRNAAR